MSLITEMRRRRVFRVAAWYAAAAWLIIQVTSTVIPQFDLPVWAVRAVIVAAVLGFPAAIILAWIFDLTAKGLERTPVAVAAAPVAAWSSPSLWIALATGALLTFGAQQAWQHVVRPATGGQPGIAVLPFDTLGVAANTAFAGGMHEAVLNELAALSGLRVIARTSVLRYATAPPDLRDVGRALNVEYVLEGSVQRDGQRLRVHAQLIDAGTNEHLWSESYDREATDIFGVQTRLASDIARRLQVTLLPGEDARSDAPPTQDAAAYEEYLAALDLLSQANSLRDDAELQTTLVKAPSLLESALRRDAEFALAHAALARALITMWFYLRDDPVAAGAREASLQEALAALKLQPSLPEAHRELGRYYYWGHFDYPNAAKSLEVARRGLPNDGETARVLGWIRRRQGRMDDAAELFKSAAEIQPNDLDVRLQVPRHYLLTFHFSEARDAARQVLGDFPGDRQVESLLAELEFCRTSDTAPLAAQLARGYGSEFENTRMRFLVFHMDGRLRELEPWAREQFAHKGPDDFLARVRLADVLRRTGRSAEAAQLVAEPLSSLEQQVAHEAEPGELDFQLMALYAVAGRSAAAAQTAQKLVNANPVSRDPLGGAEMLLWATVFYAEDGQTDNSLRFLRQYVAQPVGKCAAWIRRDPSLDSLRESPEFEKIIAPHDWRT